MSLRFKHPLRVAFARSLISLLVGMLLCRWRRTHDAEIEGHADVLKSALQLRVLKG